MSITLLEVGARDGLQNEAEFVPTAIKLELLQRFVDAGVTHIEASSFVSPKWVPQMADAEAVMGNRPRAPQVKYSVLTPNLQGLQAALAHEPDEIVIFTAASEHFNQRNINCSITESIERFRPVVEQAQAANINVRASLSCAFGCPYEGAIDSSQVMRVIEQLLAINCNHIDIADTIGVATAGAVKRVFQDAQHLVPASHLAGHFHDTYGQALANIVAALDSGIECFHSSIAGLGGCPYAKGATGNVATEDVLFLLEGLGYKTGIDLLKMVDTGQWISAQIGKPCASRAGNALAIKQGIHYAS